MARWAGRNFGTEGDDTFEREIGRDRERVMYARHSEVRDRPRTRPTSPPDPDNPADDSVAVREGRISPYAQNRNTAERAAAQPKSRVQSNTQSQTEAFFEALRELRSSPEVQSYIRSLTRNATDAARRFAQNFEMPDTPRKRRPTVEIFEDDEDDPTPSQDRREMADGVRRRVRSTRPASATTPPRKIDIDE